MTFFKIPPTPQPAHYTTVVELDLIMSMNKFLEHLISGCTDYILK